MHLQSYIYFACLVGLFVGMILTTVEYKYTHSQAKLPKAIDDILCKNRKAIVSKIHYLGLLIVFFCISVFIMMMGERFLNSGNNFRSAYPIDTEFHIFN